MKNKTYQMETEKVHEVQAATRSGRSISCLDDLIDAIGIQKTDQLFTEYMMRMVAKGKLLDEIESLVGQNGTIEDIKELL